MNVTAIQQHARALSTRSGHAVMVAHAYLHAVLGTLIATQCDWQSLSRHALQHLSFSVLVFTGVSVCCAADKRLFSFGALATLAGAWFAIRSRAPVELGLLFGAAVLLIGADQVRRRRATVPWLEKVLFAVRHGVLPFLAGYLASGHRPGGSALLLCVGFLCLLAGVHPLLSGRLQGSAGRRDAGLAVALELIGIAALGAWLWTYGSGATGIVLAAPGTFWLLWLASGWVLGDRRPLARPDRRQAHVAWLAIQIAIAIACYL